MVFLIQFTLFWGERKGTHPRDNISILQGTINITHNLPDIQIQFRASAKPKNQTVKLSTPFRVILGIQ